MGHWSCLNSLDCWCCLENQSRSRRSRISIPFQRFEKIYNKLIILLLLRIVPNSSNYWWISLIKMSFWTRFSCSIWTSQVKLRWYVWNWNRIFYRISKTQICSIISHSIRNLMVFLLPDNFWKILFLHYQIISEYF